VNPCGQDIQRSKIADGDCNKGNKKKRAEKKQRRKRVNCKAASPRAESGGKNKDAEL